MLRSISRRVLSPSATTEQKLLFDTRTQGLLSSVLPNCECTVAIISRKRPLIFKTMEEEDIAETTEFNNIDKQKLLGGGFPSITVTSDENGLFSIKFELDNDKLLQFGDNLEGLRIITFINSDMENTHSFSYCPLIPQEGVSIISDVDDTIKESSVHKGLYAAAKVALFEDMKDVPGGVDCFNMLVINLIVGQRLWNALCVGRSLPNITIIIDISRDI